MLVCPRVLTRSFAHMPVHKPNQPPTLDLMATNKEYLLWIKYNSKMFHMKKAHPLAIFAGVVCTYARVSIHIVCVCVHLACERHYSNLMRQRWIISKPPQNKIHTKWITTVAAVTLQQPTAIAHNWSSNKRQPSPRTTTQHSTTYTYIQIHNHNLINLIAFSFQLICWFLGENDIEVSRTSY